jgi:hypothetical protein
MSFQPVTKQEWIDALRSGEYDQCTGALGKLDPDTGAMSYCCLGVLATIAGVGHRFLAVRDSPDRAMDFQFDDGSVDCGVIPEAFSSTIVSDLDLAQLDRDAQCPQDDLMRILSSKNDNGTSFNEIADFLEGLK